MPKGFTTVPTPPASVAWQIVHWGGAARPSCRWMTPGKLGVASSATAIRIGGMSEIAVQLDEEGVGGGRTQRGVADHIGADVQVRDDEPGRSAPPAYLSSTAVGRREALDGRDEVHAAQDLEIRLQPSRQASLHRAVAEDGGEECIELR